MPVTTSASPALLTAQGECLEADTRLVIAPGSGVYEPAIELTTGAPVAAGQVIGHLTSGADSVPVVSPFSGQAGETLAWRGERLAAHQPVMWLSVDSGRP